MSYQSKLERFEKKKIFRKARAISSTHSDSKLNRKFIAREKKGIISAARSVRSSRKVSARFVSVPGREDATAKLWREKWSFKGRKRFVYVVKDSSGRNLARSYKVKSFSSAKRLFEKFGSFNPKKNIEFYSHTKRVSYNTGKSPRFLRRGGKYQIVASAKLPNGKVINRSSHKFDAGDKYAFEYEKEFVSEKIYSEISKELGNSYSELNGKNIAANKRIKIYYGVERWRKR